MSATAANLRSERCLEFLRPIAHQVLAEEDDVFWIDACNVDVDQHGSYCRKHGTALVEKLNAEHPEHEYMLCRGYSYESDSQEMCEECGKYLHTCLTDYGVDQDLDYVEGCRLGLRGKHAPWRAYMLIRVIECGPDPDGDYEFLRGVWGHRPDDLRERQQRIRRLTRRIDAARRSKEGTHP